MVKRIISRSKKSLRKVGLWKFTPACKSGSVLGNRRDRNAESGVVYFSGPTKTALQIGVSRDQIIRAGGPKELGVASNEEYICTHVQKITISMLTYSNHTTGVPG